MLRQGVGGPCSASLAATAGVVCHVESSGSLGTGREVTTGVGGQPCARVAQGRGRIPTPGGGRQVGGPRWCPGITLSLDGGSPSQAWAGGTRFSPCGHGVGAALESFGRPPTPNTAGSCPSATEVGRRQVVNTRLWGT